MARKKVPETSNTHSRDLSHAEISQAISRIRKRIDELAQIRVETITGRGDLAAQALEDKANATLREIFGIPSPEYYNHSVYLDTAPINLVRGTPLSTIREGYAKGRDKSISKLKTLVEILEERLEAMVDGPSKLSSNHSGSSKEVFIVHGHDQGTLNEVARFLEKLGLKPIILHEQPNQGRTIIEKFEHNSQVAFAIVLLTPDDIGGTKDQEFDELSLRARQNVILELGFFMGSLGRQNVCALYVEGVEIPSDYKGVIFVPFDKPGAWKLLLSRELQQAGFEIDLNKAA